MELADGLWNPALARSHLCAVLALLPLAKAWHFRCAQMRAVRPRVVPARKQTGAPAVHRSVLELADGLWNPALARSHLCADLAPFRLPKHGISAARKCGRFGLVSYPHENRPAHLRCTGLFWSWQTDLNPRPADYKGKRKIPSSLDITSFALIL